jgi:hydroxyisourate hydrolase
VTRITTHVLDTAAGAPARELAVTLLARDEAGGWRPLARAQTDHDGRVTTFPEVTDGLHRLQFAGRSAFFPEIVVTFSVDGDEHLHVPLLLSPFGYTTYRGS